MTELEFVLREIQFLREDLKVALGKIDDRHEGLDTEVSELKLKVDRLVHREPHHRGKAMARDGGMVISSGALTALVIALTNWLSQPKAPPPPPAPVVAAPPAIVTPGP